MIRTAIFGIGNCASSLVQGLSAIRNNDGDVPGILFERLGRYGLEDIDIVAAFDIDRRKVGKPLSEAVFAAPNNTLVFEPRTAFGNITVSAGAILDGVSGPMLHADPNLCFEPIETGEATKSDVIKVLKDSGAEVAVNFLPVGSQKATEFYAECALDAGVALINAIPVLIASDEGWSERFRAAGLPLLGDDIKAQIGATIVHRTLATLFKNRGGELDRSYQLNVGGNSDFLNMTSAERLTTKRKSKTESVQSVVKSRLADGDLRVGPSDYVAWLHDRKVAFIRMEGRLFGGAPVNIEVRMDVEDSPNAAALAGAAIRCARIARDRGDAGSIPDICAYLFKHPPVQMDDGNALDRLLGYAGEKADA